MILTPPSHGIREVTWLPQTVAAVTESPFTLVQQVQAGNAGRRSVTIDLAARRPDLAREWIGFFAALNGPVGRFYFSDTIGQNSPTVARGTPVTASGAGPGQSIPATGFNADRRVLRAGDWASVEDRLFTVTADVWSDAAGAATIPVWPPAGKTYAIGTAVEVMAPRGIFRLNELPSIRWTVNRLAEGITFTAVEALES